MTTFAVYWALFVQIMTRDTEFVGCRLTPVVNLSVLFVMALPALVVYNFLVLMMGELNSFFPHLQLYNFRAVVLRLGSQNNRRRDKQKKDKRKDKMSAHKDTPRRYCTIFITNQAHVK
jgi:hypothetical protein